MKRVATSPADLKTQRVIAQLLRATSQLNSYLDYFIKVYLNNNYKMTNIYYTYYYIQVKKQYHNIVLQSPFSRKRVQNCVQIA